MSHSFLRLFRNCLTLMELLVVIFIIAILIGTGAWLITGALTSARSVQCANNLKMQGSALLMTIEASPITGIPGLKGNAIPKAQDADGKTWKDYLTESGGAQEELFTCPDALPRQQPSYGLNPLAGATWSYPRQMFYGAGFLLLPGETRPCNVDLIKRPAHTAILTDAGRISESGNLTDPTLWQEIEAPWQPFVAFPFADTRSKTYGQTFDYGYDWGNTAPGNCRGSLSWDQFRRPLGRHKAGCNTLFLDSHVKTLPAGTLVGAQWNSPDCLFGNQ